MIAIMRSGQKSRRSSPRPSSNPTRGRVRTKRAEKPRQKAGAKAEVPAKAKAKLFWTGRSQAVRLPKEFRFEGDTVLVHREGNKVILEPDYRWPPGWLEWLMSGPHLPPDFEIPDDPPPEPVDLFSDEIPPRHQRR
jgi:antitoxin VapB